MEGGTVGEWGEDRLVAAIRVLIEREQGIPASPIIHLGDDCALLPALDEGEQLHKTDCIVQDVHFLPDTDPELIGKKAINRVVSDFAAMGGAPQSLLLTILVGRDVAVDRILLVYQGALAAARAASAFIVGGETSSLPSPGALAISVAGTGRLLGAQAVVRSGAQPGDGIWVTGILGNSFDTGWHLSFKPRLQEAAWLSQLSAEVRPTSMMDLSDGLGQDLPRLAAASDVGYRIKEESLPLREGASVRSALADGEDYELLFTAPPDADAHFAQHWSKAFPDVRLTQIGEIHTEQDPHATIAAEGFEHFSGNGKERQWKRNG